jgi:TolA-binding protein
MHDDRLRTLLEKADAGIAPDGLGAAELSNMAKVLHLRRRRRRITAAATATVLLCLVAAWRAAEFFSGMDKKTNIAAFSPVPAADVAALKEKLAKLEEKIQRQEQVIDRLLTAERCNRLQAAADRRLLKPTGRELLDQQLSQTAATMLLCADEEYKIPAYKESALENYNLVIKTFPQTAWAEKAKDRLNAVQGRDN